MSERVPSRSGAPDGYELWDDETFNSFVGPFYLREATGRQEGLFQVRKHHLNRGQVAHGGMLMTFADMVMGRAAAEANGGVPCATISLNCDFVSAAKLGDWVEGAARIVRKTRSVLFVSGELSTEGRILLTASGLWKVLHAG